MQAFTPSIDIIHYLCTKRLVSFPDPFCARARNLKLGGGERPGKGSGKSSRPSTGNGRNAGAVRMECS